MRTRGKTLEEGLASIDPLADEDLAEFASGSGPDEVLRAILASGSDRARRPGRAVRRWLSLRSWPGRTAVAVPVAATALIASVVGVPGGSGGTPTTLPALARVAEAAADLPAPATALPYRYEKTQGRYLDSAVWSRALAWSYFVSETDEEWIAKDGSGRRHRIVAPVEFAAPKDREAWEAAGRPDFQPDAWTGHTEDETLRPGSESNRIWESEISEIPTDSAAMSEWLLDQVTRSHNGFSPAVRSLGLVSDILNDPLATPELRAALYEAEGHVPGIEYFGKAIDAIGRPGVAIGAESANSGAPTRYELIFDPRTSQVLATEETWLEPPSAFSYMKTPVLSSAKVFIESGGVRSPGERPAG